MNKTSIAKNEMTEKSYRLTPRQSLAIQAATSEAIDHIGSYGVDLLNRKVKERYGD